MLGSWCSAPFPYSERLEAPSFHGEETSTQELHASRVSYSGFAHKLNSSRTENCIRIKSFFLAKLLIFRTEERNKDNLKKQIKLKWRFGLPFEISGQQGACSMKKLSPAPYQLIVYGLLFWSGREQRPKTASFISFSDISKLNAYRNVLKFKKPLTTHRVTSSQTGKGKNLMIPYEILHKVLSTHTPSDSKVWDKF